MGIVDQVGGKALEFARAMKAVGSTKWQPPTPGNLGRLNAELPPVLEAARISLGCELYQHQVEAIEALRRGEDVALTLPTASGKTLCFSVPMLEAIVEQQGDDKAFRGMLVVPQRALATDQEGKLKQWVDALKVHGADVNVVKLTGDVSTDRLEMFRSVPDLLIISPECLHFLLRKVRDARFAGFRQFLKQLRFVAVDEVQAFDSVLGSNFANVLRRLRLAVMRCSGTLEQIQYIVSSATIANPQQVWSQLSGRPDHYPFSMIQQSDAPFPGRLIVATNGKLSSRAKIAQLMEKVAQDGQAVLVFVNSRSQGKRLLQAVQGNLKRQGRRYSTVAFFHGTLPAVKRQQIAQQVHSGQIKLIISTSALEIGVDFAEIGCVIAWGYPGANQLIQRFGRAGRGGKPGVAIFVPAMYNILDQQVAKDSSLLESGTDAVFINANYPYRLEKHILAAAWESGIRYQEELEQVFGDAGLATALRLVESGMLTVKQGYLRAATEIHRFIALRGQRIGTITLVNCEGDQPIEEFSHALAIRELYPGAIYVTQDEGRQRKYRVLSLDSEVGQAFCEEIGADSTLTTEAMSEGWITPDEETVSQQKIIDCGNRAALNLWLGWGDVVQEVAGYQEILTLTTVSCQNATCPSYNIPISDRHSHCDSCASEMVASDQSSLVKEVMLKDPLRQEYRTVLLTIRANCVLRSRLSQMFRQMAQRQIQGGASSSDKRWLSAQDPVILGLHTLSHLIMSALKLRSRELDAQDMISIGIEGDVEISLFDSAEGGTGTCEYLFEHFRGMVQPAYHVGAECDCVEQCPKCSTLIQCSSNNSPLYRPLGVSLLEQIMNAKA